MGYIMPFQNAVTFEVSNDRNHYQRNVYTILDLLSDVGGLIGVIYPISYGLALLF